MKRTLKVLLVVLIIASSVTLFAACGNKGGSTSGVTGELTLANYNSLKVGKATPSEARSALGSPTIDQIVSVPIVGESGNMIWEKGGITVTLQFANGKLLQKVQTGLS